jgi:hypothetical protein
LGTSRHAVVIGVNKYEDHPNIPELKGAENDATELHQRLVDKESGGFDIAERHFLTGKKATCDAIRKALSDLLWQTDSSDLSLFYFSGHGFHDEYGDGYIAPWDMRRNEPMVRGICMRELTNLLRAAKMKKTVLMILDCCYSGIATEGKGGMANDLEKTQFDEWFSAVTPEEAGKGRIVLASAGKDERSHELLTCAHTLAPGGQEPHPHGAFTFHLLEALDGKAATENDAITLEGLIKYIQTKMENHPEHSPEHYGAAVAGDIIIARASQWRKIRESLEEAKRRLERGDPNGTFAAATALGDIITTYTTFPEACELKELVDAKLSTYQDAANLWLLREKFRTGYEFQEAFERLVPLAGTLSVDVVVGLRQEPELQAVLESLCAVSCRRPDSEETYMTKDVFVRQLKSLRSAQSQQKSAAKLETPGQVKIS